MGDFHIAIKAQGGHGCQRELGNGDVVEGCGQTECPDCKSRAFVKSLQASGAVVGGAVLIHWPGTPEEVMDNLLTGIRSGSFKG